MSAESVVYYLNREPESDPNDQYDEELQQAA